MAKLIHVKITDYIDKTKKQIKAAILAVPSSAFHAISTTTEAPFITFGGQGSVNQMFI